MNTNVYKEPVKLIALDLDRTTLKSDGHISKANRQAVEYAISKGYMCVLQVEGAFVRFLQRLLQYLE